jgi:hypothetical protein
VCVCVCVCSLDNVSEDAMRRAHQGAKERECYDQEGSGKNNTSAKRPAAKP